MKKEKTERSIRVNEGEWVSKENEYKVEEAYMCD